MEAKLQNSLYKLEIHWLKIIPMVISALSLTDTLLSYFDIDVPAISYINALLVWLFLYLSSIVFKFCRWHRMFLYYLLFEGIVNWYDYTFIIPLGLKAMIVVQVFIAMTFICIGLYLHQHDKLPRRENIGKAS